MIFTFDNYVVDIDVEKTSQGFLSWLVFCAWAGEHSPSFLRQLENIVVSRAAVACFFP